MRVDVLSTGSQGGQSGQSMVTRTILQNVQVISTGQNTDHDKPTAAQSVNLLVTPEQAETLSLAIAQTRIQLVLRNPLDKGSVTPQAVSSRNPFQTASDVMPRFAPANRAPRAAAKQEIKPAETGQLTVEVIHGTKKVVTIVGAATVQDAPQ
jgi:Flp pilus assembly protein CpaB